MHLYGQPADLAGIQAALEAAGRGDVLIIEDACQAHGARIGDRRVGSIGVMSAFSFYPTKNLGAFGDGGMVTTNDAELATTLRTLRDGGQTSKYHHQILGFNSRLDELQAGLLSVRLAGLDGENARRSAIAARYQEGLADCASLSVPQVATGRTSVWHMYVVRCTMRDALKGISPSTGWVRPCTIRCRFIASPLSERHIPNSRRCREPNVRSRRFSRCRCTPN